MKTCIATEGLCGDGMQINKLLAAFQSHTGNSFTGNAGEYEQLAAFAQKMTGT